MGDDHILARDLRGDAAQLAGDELVREPVEAIAPHAFVVIGARQGEGVGHERMSAMEGGVEAGDLRDRRKGLHSRFDAGDVVGLVQRRERDQAPELRQHLAVDQDRLGKIRPAVHDAMADRRYRIVMAGVLQPAENCAHRRTMVDAGERALEVETRRLARCCLDRALRRRAESLDLSRGQQGKRAAVGDAEGGEFERG